MCLVKYTVIKKFDGCTRPNIEAAVAKKNEDELPVFIKVRFRLIVQTYRKASLLSVLCAQIIKCTTDEERSNALREKEILHTVSRTNPRFVAKLVDSAVEPDKVVLVTMLGHVGDLCDMIRSKGALTARTAYSYWRDMLCGLLELKRLHIAHGDVSLENVVVFQDQRARLVDLGSSILVGDPVPTHHYYYRGKIGYVPPEIVTHVFYIDPYAVDVWALGCCLYTMVTGSVLFNKPGESSYEFMLSGRLVELLLHYIRLGVSIPPSVCDIITRIMTVDAGMRPSIEEIIAFEF
jgi:serine/threonine protein kinase